MGDDASVKQESARLGSLKGDGIHDTISKDNTPR